MGPGRLYCNATCIMDNLIENVLHFKHKGIVQIYGKARSYGGVFAIKVKKIDRTCQGKKEVTLFGTTFKIKSVKDLESLETFAKSVEEIVTNI